MTISKSTLNYAKKRSLYVDMDFCETCQANFVWVGVDDDCSEPMFSLFANADGSFTYRGNIWLKASTREEIPSHIANEKQLRAVLNFISSDMRIEIANCIN